MSNINSKMMHPLNTQMKIAVVTNHQMNFIINQRNNVMMDTKRKRRIIIHKISAYNKGFGSRNKGKINQEGLTTKVEGVATLLNLSNFSQIPNLRVNLDLAIEVIIISLK